MKKSKRKIIKPIYAFATFHPGGNGYPCGINPFLIRTTVKDVREHATVWKLLRKRGWRVIKVKITSIGKPI
jgi:hypothetical protein